MTLLESIVAFVLLAVVGVACLDLAQGASRLQFSSREWSAAIATAESAMAEELAGAPRHASDGGREGDSRAAVSRRGYRAGLDLVEVTVPLSDGRAFHLQRVVPAP